MSNDDQGMTHYFTPEQEAREKMWADFEAEFDRIRKMNWVVELPMPSHFMMHEKDPMWVSWQACAAQSAETITKQSDIIAKLELELGSMKSAANFSNDIISRLEAEVEHLKQINHVKQVGWDQANTRAAAAQADNARLRESANNYIANDGSGGTFDALLLADARDKLRNLLAQPLDTTALETYVAKNKVLDKAAVEWVVNDSAELGVKIGDQFFFLYKGESLVYSDAKHDNGSQMMWRHVFKREFGECCHPVNYSDSAKWGTVSLNDSDEWAPLPPAPDKQRARVLMRLDIAKDWRTKP